MIVQTITNDYAFYEWLKQSGSYQTSFSVDGARALQEYLDNLSEEIDQPIEFDPVAWCCDWAEYADIDDFNDSYFGKEYKAGSEYTLETLQDNTTVIQFAGGIIVEAF